MSATKPQQFQVRTSSPLSSYTSSLFVDIYFSRKSWEAKAATDINDSFLLLLCIEFTF